jgi:glycosyltransferase involved in cell wall biosynthesis
VPRIFAIVEGLGYAFTPGRELKRRLVRAVLGPALKIALGLCNGVFVLNSDDRASLMGLGILSARQNVTQIAGTGIDLDHYAYVPPTPGPPRFLLIARLIRDKGVFEYVEAARLVKAKHPEARFRLLGSLDDHPGAVTRAQIAAWEREGLIEYLDVTDDVRPYLADCTVYVLPSYREGMPRTIMEAMAVGRPVVATDVPGCRDAVEDGVTGILVPPRDAGGLARALEWLIQQPNVLAEMRCAGRRRAEADFALSTVNAVTLDALRTGNRQNTNEQEVRRVIIEAFSK